MRQTAAVGPAPSASVQDTVAAGRLPLNRPIGGHAVAGDRLHLLIFEAVSGDVQTKHAANIERSERSTSVPTVGSMCVLGVDIPIRHYSRKMTKVRKLGRSMRAVDGQLPLDANPGRSKWNRANRRG